MSVIRVSASELRGVSPFERLDAGHLGANLGVGETSASRRLVLLYHDAGLDRHEQPQDERQGC